MGKYQIYNRSSWVDLCDCNLNVLNHNNIWKKIDPRKCQVRFWNGTEWCPVVCKEPELGCVTLESFTDCNNFGDPMVFSSSSESSICPNNNCSGLIAYIPVLLTQNLEGFTVEFEAGFIYDGLDIVDECQTQVYGGIGMIGTGAQPNQRVSPGTYTYDNMIWFNTSTGLWEPLPTNLSIPNSIDMTFIQVKDFNGVINYQNDNNFVPGDDVVFDDFQDMFTLTGLRGASRGYQNYLSRGIPMPQPNQMYITADKSLNQRDRCPNSPTGYTGQVESNAPAVHATDPNFNNCWFYNCGSDNPCPPNVDEETAPPNFKLHFLRPPSPGGTHPPQEMFLIRVFGHPLTTNTGFSIQNIECLTK